MYDNTENFNTVNLILGSRAGFWTREKLKGTLEV